MHARVMRVQVSPDRLDEAERIYRESAAPEMKRLQGFRGVLLLTDPRTGGAISVTLWETEEDRRAGEESPYLREQIAKFQPLFTAPPQQEAYRVALRDEPSLSPA